MLVQICCSVDSEYFIKCLKKDYPNEKIIGYFYDPNIHPYSEFLLRYEDSKRSAAHYGVEVLLGEYDIKEWFRIASGLENEPERGERCQKCFDLRIFKTAQKALEIGKKTITTTLLMSPKKKFAQLTSSMSRICAEFNLDFIAPDYRKNGGTQAQMALSKTQKLYHQNYCGCVFGLILGRQKQNSTFNQSNKFPNELFSPIGGEILPNSPEFRLNLYKKAANLEQNGTKFEIKKHKFINYRLLSAKASFDGKIVPSFLLFNSHFERKTIKANIDEIADEIYIDRDEIRLISLKKFNKISNLQFKTTKELLFNSPSVEAQLNIKKQILGIDDFSPVIVVDEIYPCKALFEINSNIFVDIMEILAIIR
ncbi:MAG: epoxyqueuosine reductase QueH [Campylobacter sp.]|nr:epoxyqueuosine reductase QueH [Campylobacter sp.]